MMFIIFITKVCKSFKNFNELSQNLFEMNDISIIYLLSWEWKYIRD